MKQSGSKKENYFIRGNSNNPPSPRLTIRQPLTGLRRLTNGMRWGAGCLCLFDGLSLLHITGSSSGYLGGQDPSALTQDST